LRKGQFGKTQGSNEEIASGGEMANAPEVLKRPSEKNLNK